MYPNKAFQKYFEIICLIVTFSLTVESLYACKLVNGVFDKFSIGFSSVIVAEMTKRVNWCKDYGLETYTKFTNFSKF